MFNRTLWKAPILGFLIPFGNLHDIPKKSDNQTQIDFTQEDGMDRLKRMFTIDPATGNIRKELQSVWNGTLFGAVSGMIYGGIIKSRDTARSFIENNKATLYIDARDAKRSLQTNLLLNFLRQGVPMGCRLSLLCLFFGGYSTCICVYRGKYTLPNYILGGALAGMTYRFPVGPKAMLVGTGLGGVLGIVYGGSMLFLLKIFGINMEELQQRHVDVVIATKRRITQSEYIEKEASDMRQFYTENIQLKDTIENGAPGGQSSKDTVTEQNKSK